MSDDDKADDDAVLKTMTPEQRAKFEAWRRTQTGEKMPLGPFLQELQLSAARSEAIERGDVIDLTAARDKRRDK